ncbi:MAG: hypothetical protein ACM3XM_10080 [Mycobacterium leprae]
MLMPQWERLLPYSPRGVLRPTVDPVGNRFYVSDGVGTPPGALQLRAMALTDGAEVGAVSLREPARALAFLPDDTLMVATGKRLLLLDRATLGVRQEWTEHVPRDSDYLAVAEGRALLCSRGGPNLAVYHLSGKVSKKRVGSCRGIAPSGDLKRFLLYGGDEGIIWSYAPVNGRLSERVQVPPFVRAAWAPDLSRFALVLAMGKEVGYFPPGSLVRVYQNEEPLTYQECTIPVKFQEVALSDDGALLYAFGHNQLSILSSATGVELERLTIDSHWRIRSLFPERGCFVAAAGFDERSLAGFTVPSRSVEFGRQESRGDVNNLS